MLPVAVSLSVLVSEISANRSTSPLLQGQKGGVSASQQVPTCTHSLSPHEAGCTPAAKIAGYFYG